MLIRSSASLVRYFSFKWGKLCLLRQVQSILADLATGDPGCSSPRFSSYICWLIPLSQMRKGGRWILTPGLLIPYFRV